MLENVKIKAVFKTLYTLNNNKISVGKNIFFIILVIQPGKCWQSK